MPLVWYAAAQARGKKTSVWGRVLAVYFVLGFLSFVWLDLRKNVWGVCLYILFEGALFLGEVFGLKLLEGGVNLCLLGVWRCFSFRQVPI